MDAHLSTDTTFERDFKNTLFHCSTVPPTDESLARWEQLLQDDQLKRLEQLVDQMKLWDAPKTIAEPKSFLHHAHLQPVIEPKHVSCQSKSDTTKPCTPLQYACQQLDEDFLEWLLARPATDVNLRNNFKQTALTMLCEDYNLCMRRNQQACPHGQLGKIRTVILRLLQAGADFNICSVHMKLPFELLLKHCETHDETRQLVEKCVQQVRVALAICSTNERNERLVGFYNNNPNVHVTVELLEIFLRYSDRTNFATHMAGFKISGENVKKVIRHLLHTACDQKLPDCVKLILDHDRDGLIFKVLNRKPGRNATTRPTDGPGTSNMELSRRFGWQESNDVQKSSELEHRVELKGVLKKVCLMADLPLLQLMIAKISDLIVLNDDPLLVVTLTKAYDFRRKVEERNALLACAEFLATQETIHMSKRDNSGNTSLHLALKYGFTTVALALLRQRYTYLGMRNNDNLTPLDYGSYAFWKSYLDQCIEVDLKRAIPDRNVIRFNLQGFHSPALGITTTTVNADGVPVATEKPKSKRAKWKLVQRADDACNQPRMYTRTITEMTVLRQIAQSMTLKRLLLHPVLYAFIMVKWTRLSHWNYINLFFTALTILFFGWYSLTVCSATGPNITLWWLSMLGVVFVFIRELLQVLFLRWSYLSFENTLELIVVVAMVSILANGCNGLLSSFVIINFAMQLTFLLGSLQSNNIATMMYMFKTVSKNFLKSFILFMPLICAFVYAFHLTYNETPEEQNAVCNKDDGCSEDNFNNFRTFWNATIKTLVMTTGEFEAAAINFEGGKMFLFIVFIFFAPIVILNLINGLAVSDIAAIREESELISISKKVMLLEQYERGVADVYPRWLRHCFPKPYFADHDCRIHLKTKAHRKLEAHVRQAPPSKQGKVGLPPGGGGVLNNLLNRVHGSSQFSIRMPNGGRVDKQKVQSQPLPKVPWLPKGCVCDYIIDIRIFRIALFMRLDQSIVDEALAIIERQQAVASVPIVAKGATPTPESPVPPVRIPVAANVRKLRTASPLREKRTKSLETDDMKRELQEVKTQLKTVLELLRRKEQQEKRKDKQHAQERAQKRKAKKRVRKGMKKNVTPEAQMGDQ
uniref:Ion transport domain-containing protein n=1 Tax=Anopheles epiroticus TaxID=199890 RepID=A0A182PDM8_9DIPT